MTPALVVLAAVCALVVLGLLLCHHAPEIGRGLFGASADELPEADLLHRDTDPYVVDRTTCGATRGALTCGRFPGHDGPHADPYTGRGDWPVKWLDAEPPFGGAA